MDFMGRELSIVYHENGKEFKVSYVYDKNGTLLQETGRDGTVIYYTYDARNRLIQKKQVKDAEQRIWKTAYGYEWTAGEKELLSVLRQESPGGSVDETYMDQAGKTVRTCSGGLMTENEYDKDGRVTAQRITSEDGSIKGSTTVTLHDAEGNVTASIINPEIDKMTGAWTVGEDSVVTSSTYDALNRQMSFTDAEGNVTEYVYDNLGALKEVWQDDGTGQKNVTAYAKDFLEADGTTSSSVIDANGNMSKEYFNAEGYKLRTADLGDGTVSPITTKYEYDDKGNTSKETYGDGTYKTFQYDAGGRMTLEQCFKAGGNQTLETRYTYSDLGQLLTMEDFQVKNGQKSRYRYTAYTYDGLGQIISTVEYSGSNVPDEEALEKHRMKYSYDLGGRLAEITYPSARDSQIRAVKYVYDGNGRKTGVDAVLQDGSEKVVARYQYTAIGNLDTETVYRGFLDGASDKVLYKKYQYNALSRVTQVSCYDSAAMQNCLDTYKYSYDKNFRIVTEDIVCQYPGMERVDELRSYEYDGLGRLKKKTVRDRAAGCSRETAYTYDKVGNMLTEAEGNMTKHMAYNSLNQMVSSTTVRGGKQESQCAYTYDSRGNLGVRYRIIFGILLYRKCV